jgi:hypothetical protein
MSEERGARIKMCPEPVDFVRLRTLARESLTGIEQMPQHAHDRLRVLRGVPLEGAVRQARPGRRAEGGQARHAWGRWILDFKIYARPSPVLERSLVHFY